MAAFGRADALQAPLCFQFLHLFENGAFRNAERYSNLLRRDCRFLHNQIDDLILGFR